MQAEDIAVSGTHGKPWALSAQEFANYMDSLPEGSPLKSVTRRSAIIRAIALGEPVPESVAAEYPDIIQLADPGSVEPWVITCLRRPAKSATGRYVLSDGELFNVYPVQQNYLVARVSFYAQANKVVHEPFSVEESESLRAVAAYENVMRFIANPASAKSLILKMYAQPAESKPAKSKRMAT